METSTTSVAARNPYATNKLTAWPDAWRALNAGTDHLTTIHLMPQNLCNHHCEFCSYRMPENKNSIEFDVTAALPLKAAISLLDDLKTLGVQGIEVTGGGEPLAYPEINELLQAIAEREFAIGLVTNGTLYTRARETILDLKHHLRWVRVSIDAGDAETYAKMRLCPTSHWDRAWRMVRELGEASDCRTFHPDFQVGAGFVLSNANCKQDQINWFVETAHDQGADNVRLSSTFSDQHMDYFVDRKAIDLAALESVQVQGKLFSPDFTVHNLIPSRLWETQHHTQDYKPCLTKDLLCVVEGTGDVYPCCTFTGSGQHVYGNILKHPNGFQGVWKDTEHLRQQWDASAKCKVSCLYRDRNLAMIDLLDHPTPPPRNGDIAHPEFI